MQFLKDKNFISSLLEKNVALCRQGFDTVPTWDEIFFDLTQSLKKGYLVREFDNFSFTTHNAVEHLQCCKHFIEITHPFFPGTSASAHIYTHLTTLSNGLGNHKDTDDVLFCQIHGKTLWKVNNFQFILEPKDIIFVPKGVNHHVISMTPRVGISFGFT